MDLVLNNLQRLICHKTPTNNKPLRVIVDLGVMATNLLHTFLFSAMTRVTLSGRVSSFVRKYNRRILSITD